MQKKGDRPDIDLAGIDPQTMASKSNNPTTLEFMAEKFLNDTPRYLF